MKSQCDYTDAKSLQQVAFKMTPIMLTYLVEFVVGEFDFIEEILENGVLARVYTPLGKTKQGQFALEVGTSEEKKPKVLLVTFQIRNRVNLWKMN